MSKSSDDLLGDSSYIDHNTSGDLDLFTLLEENIALKERTENLLSQKNSRMFDCILIASMSAALVSGMSDSEMPNRCDMIYLTVMSVCVCVFAFQ